VTLAGSFESGSCLPPVTVYLDDWRQPARLGPVDDRWSHLVADSDEELHAFAARLGMKRAWFQHKEGRPHQGHYDVPERARQDALELGAVSVTWRQVGRMMRERRTGQAGPDRDILQPADGVIGP
jgi:hypothetical protein